MLNLEKNLSQSLQTTWPGTDFPICIRAWKDKDFLEAQKYAEKSTLPWKRVDQDIYTRFYIGNQMFALAFLALDCNPVDLVGRNIGQFISITAKMAELHTQLMHQVFDYQWSINPDKFTINNCIVPAILIKIMNFELNETLDAVNKLGGYPKIVLWLSSQLIEHK